MKLPSDDAFQGDVSGRRPYLMKQRHRSNARILYAAYRRAQQKVDEMEADYIRACKGNKQLAMIELTVSNPEAKQKYAVLRGDRDGLFNQLQAEIGMAGLNQEA